MPTCALYHSILLISRFISNYSILINNVNENSSNEFQSSNFDIFINK